MASRRLRYYDASAFVKLFQREPESEELWRSLSGEPVASELLEIEARRVGRRRGGAAPGVVDSVLPLIDLIPINAEVRELAASVGPPGLRALDAIHLATAFLLRERLDALVTYDARLGEAAEAMGLRVLSPR